MAARSEPTIPKWIPTPTVGEMLREEFLEPLGMTPYRLARELRVATSSVLDLGVCRIHASGLVVT